MASADQEMMPSTPEPGSKSYSKDRRYQPRTPGSTPSKVLAKKFQSLDQRWSARKAQAPFEMVRTSTERDKDTIESDNTTTDDRDRNVYRHQSSLGIEAIAGGNSKPLLDPVSPAIAEDKGEDSSSVGASTISTLSSTESVFDRLYRQAIGSPKLSSGTAVHEGSYASSSLPKGFPTSPPFRNTRNVKDRLGAYGTAANDTRSLGYEEYTPRRQTRHATSNRSVGTGGREVGVGSDDTVGSSHCGPSQADSSSVFARLFRNEKRSEKLWKKPAAFTPKLAKSASSGGRSGRQRGPASLGLEEITSNLYRDIQEPLPAFTADANTTLEEDLEAIKELGRQLGGGDECSPTVAGTSVSTVEHDNHGTGTGREPSPLGGRFIDAAGASVEEEFSVVEAVGKQLESRKSDQQRFLSQRLGANYNTSYQGSSVETRTKVIPSAIHSDNRASFSLSGDTHTDSTATGTETYGFFTLDHPVRSYFFAERIDRLSTPLRKRWRAQGSNDDSMNNTQFQPEENTPHCDHGEVILTPRRIRHASSVTIQRSWRLHQVDLRLASSMLKNWKAHFVHSQGGNCTSTLITRKRALKKAIKVVGCWWILQGFCMEDNWVTIAWENEVSVGDSTVQVHLSAEALSAESTSHWGDRKLAILIVKAAFIKAIQGEIAAERVGRWYKRHKCILHRNAALFQGRTRNRLAQRTDIVPNKELMKLTESFGVDSARAEIDGARSPGHSDSSFDLRGEVMEELPSPINLSGDPQAHIDTAAAITIQNWLRLTVLKSALKERPSTLTQVGATLRPNDSSVGTEFAPPVEFETARSYLNNPMIAMDQVKSKCSWLNHSDNSDSDFITQRAASLANLNIHRTYLLGLNKYRKKKNATMIQAVYRGHRARKRLERRHFAAVIIQFAWSYNEYRKVKMLNAVVIQRFWRMTYCSREYKKIRFCVLHLQAGWRRAIGRKRFTTLRFCSVLLQRNWRGRQPRDRYVRFLSAIKSLQHQFRTKHMIGQFQVESRSAIAIQNRWRMVRAQDIFYGSRKLIRSLQSQVRRYQQLKNFRCLREKILVIQRHWRQHRQRKAYRMQANAAIRLQSCWRRFSAFEKYELRKECVILVQRFYRGYRCRASFLQCTKSARKLQPWLRGVFARQHVLQEQLAAIEIQRIWRCKIARQDLRHLKWTKAIASAVVIQTRWRSSSARRRYIRALSAIITIQSTGRTLVAVCSYYDMVATKRGQQEQEAVISVQRMYRGLKVRTHLRTLHSSAERIQTIWRGRHGMSTFDAIRSFIVSIQSWWRGSVARRSLYRQLRAAQTIQRFSRAMKEELDRLRQKRSLDSTVLLQSWWRASVSRGHFRRARMATVSLQAIFRRMLSRRHYSSLRFQQRLETQTTAVLCIMGAYKEYKARHLVRTMSATKIQALWRINASRREFRKAVFAIVAIQASWRGVRTKVLEERNFAANQLQRYCRGILARQSIGRATFNHAIASVVVIQRMWRGSSVRGYFHLVRISVILVQAGYRSVLARRSLTHARIEQLLETEGDAAGIVQQWYRAWNVRSVASSLNNLDNSIQATWRGSHVRDARGQTLRSSLSLQSGPRVSYHRPLVSTQQSAASKVQRTWRDHVAKGKVKLVVLAAKRIQKAWFCSKNREALNIRDSLERRRAGSFNLEIHGNWEQAAVLIQSLFRCKAATKEFESILSSCCIIQRATRRYQQTTRYHESQLAAVGLQSSWRAARARVSYMTTLDFVVIIQSFWRGALVRSIWWFVRLLSQKRAILDDAARKIQVAFHIFKMELAALEMKSLVVLLERGVRGQLVRSSVRYALLQMNSSFHPMNTISYDRLALDQEQGVTAVIAWDRAVAQARVAAATVIQSFMRRMIVRNRTYRHFGVSFEAIYVDSHLLAKQEKSISVIQKAYRMWQRQRLGFIIKIQKITRGCIQRMRYREIDLTLRQCNIESAATHIQALERRRKWHETSLKKRRNIVLIQRCWREASSRRLNLRVQGDVYVLPRNFCPVSEDDKHMNVTKIQSIIRGVGSRRLAEERRKLVKQQERDARIQIVASAEMLGNCSANDLLHGRKKASGPCLDRLVHRVISAICDAKVACDRTFEISNPEIPLPCNVPKYPSAATSLRRSIETSAKSTPVRCNKAIAGLQPLIGSKDTKSVHALPTRLLRWKLETDAEMHYDKHEQGGSSPLVVPATLSLDHARNALEDCGQLNKRSDASLEADPNAASTVRDIHPRHGEGPGNSTLSVAIADDNIDSLIFGGNGPLPSPIRETKRVDWNWTDEW